MANPATTGAGAFQGAGHRPFDAFVEQDIV